MIIAHLFIYRECTETCAGGSICGVGNECITEPTTAAPVFTPGSGATMVSTFIICLLSIFATIIVYY